jgi:branched-chain amino acid aminotransferase
MKFALLNNQLTEEKEIRLTNKNRGFLYGDGFFETIKIFNKKPFNLQNHFHRIIYSVDLLDIKFSLSILDLNKSISMLIDKNNIQSGSVRVSIYRNSIGKYLPKENSSSILINSKNDIEYMFVKRKFLDIGYYKENLKSPSPLSNLKSLNSLLYVMASKYAKENNFDDVILFNTNKNIIETTNSNLFILNHNKVITSPLKDGCVDGSMRKLLFLIIKNKYELIEESISENDIENSSEVILSNSTYGVRGVKKINIKTYNDSSLYNYLINSLNKLI